MILISKIKFILRTFKDRTLHLEMANLIGKYMLHNYTIYGDYLIKLFLTVFLNCSTKAVIVAKPYFLKKNH